MTVVENANRLSAVIITGGPSPLFGPTDTKAEAARERLIERLAWTLAEFPFAQFALIAPSGKAGVEPEGVSVLADDETGLGAIGGIATALRHLPSGILVAASNMPFITHEMVSWLLRHNDPQAAAVIPWHARGKEPFFAIYNKTALPRLKEIVEGESDVLRSTPEKAGVRYINVPEEFYAPRDFTRVHTPREYELALESFEKKISR
jgi:molybdopterin-guanine dinucleotide biosynthesis protein A